DAPATDRLNEVMKWRPDDPVAQQLAVTLAERAGDFEASKQHVADYTGNPLVGPVERLDARLTLELKFHRQDEAQALLAQTRAEASRGPEGMGGCAGHELELGAAWRYAASPTAWWLGADES